MIQQLVFYSNTIPEMRSLCTEEKHQKDVETITQREKEKSNLTDQVKAQKDAHRHLKSEYQEMIETLTNSKKIIEETFCPFPQ
ncbi:hypothetical protein QTP86_015887 [Hemibagrus guttatus]|nr:hypothetical protein QTP86_015887 [Hemibagrus guttatus]